jgi:DVNP family
MKRPHRAEDGHYHIKGKKYSELFGSRTQVMNGTAYKTAGELTKTDLIMNKWGRIVSKKKHTTAKKEKRLEKAGYYAKKGHFGYVRKTLKNKSRKSKK